MSTPAPRPRQAPFRALANGRPRKARSAFARLEALEPRTLLATILVTTNADTIDPADNALSLREAIEISNGTLPVSSLSPIEQVSVSGPLSLPAPNTILFSIPGGGTQVISATSPLPTITAPVAIDAMSQPGALYNPTEEPDVDLATLTLRLDGFALATAQPALLANGLTIAAPNCTVNGMIITGFKGSAVAITGASSQGNFLFSNFFGALPDPVNGRNFPGGPSLSNGVGLTITASNNRIGGNNPGLRNVIANNGVGVRIDTSNGTGNLLQGNFILDNTAQGVYVSASNNTIGEALAGGGNVISGNGAEGVLITGGANVQGNNLLGNLIGTDMGIKGGARPKGIDPRPNLLQGVRILDSPKNTVGGTNEAARNVIGGNLGDGLVIEGAESSANRVLGNWVGFNIVNGLVSLYIQNQNGVVITAPGNVLGGTVSGAGNTISLNRAHGVLISGAGASGTSVLGNTIGLNPDKGSDFGNALDGIHVDNVANTLIGGTSEGARNFISGNNNGIVLFGANTTGSRILGNFIGTAGDGQTDLGNAVNGIFIVDSPLNTIGGTETGAGNVISGNDRGVVITGATSRNNVLQGNFIGTDLTGVFVINNEIDGVLITGGASFNSVGGTLFNAGNTIAFNAGDGVRVESGNQNTIRNNSIHDNQRRGIALNTSNNANANQPAPIVTAIEPQGTRVTVSGLLNALPSTTFDIEFFANPDKGASGNGEVQPYQARRYLGKTSVTTDATGLVVFSYDIPTLVTSGEWVTATATDPQGNTSEISNAQRVPTQLQFANLNYTVNESEGSIVVTVNRTGGLGGEVSVAYATANGTATAGNQYTAVNGTLFFLSNDPLPKTFSIPILHTANIGGSSTFLVNLSDSTNGATLGTPSTTTVSIIDDDTGLKFSSPTATVNEAEGTVTLTVTRPSAVGTASVNYATANGSAIAGVNYVAKSGTVNFAAGEVSKPITITLIGDNVVTGSLTFSVVLSNPVGALIEPPGTVVVTMTDADAPGVLAFTTSTVVVQPGATSATLTVKRTAGKGGTVTVNYGTGGGTAVPGTDYTTTAGVLTLGPGETSKTISVPILNPGASAVSSNFVVTLSSPGGGATLGSVTTTNVKIQRATSPVGPVNPGTPTGDVTPPTVVSVTPVSGFGGVTSIVIGFSEPLDLNRAQNIANYGTFATSFGRDNIPNTRDDSNVAIVAATYDPGSRRVTLRLASALSSSLRYYVNLNGDASSGSGRGIADQAGNLLAGDGRNAGTPYLVTIGTTIGTPTRVVTPTRTTTPTRVVPTPTTSRGRTTVVRRTGISARAVDTLTTTGTLPRTGTLLSWARRR